MFQVHPASGGAVDLAALAARLSRVAEVAASATTLRATLPSAWLTVCREGRALVEGAADAAAARRLYVELVGA
jgi:hypothetical protein